MRPAHEHNEDQQHEHIKDQHFNMRTDRWNLSPQTRTADLSPMTPSGQDLDIHIIDTYYSTLTELFKHTYHNHHGYIIINATS